MKQTIKVVETGDGGYRAWCPALPGCVASGRTRNECYRNIKQAINAYLARLDEPATNVQTAPAESPGTGEA